jgi:hypothetical protein
VGLRAKFASNATRLGLPFPGGGGKTRQGLYDERMGGAAGPFRACEPGNLY